MSKNGRIWGEEEVEYLKENLDKLPFSLIAKKLNRTDGAIRNKSLKLKFKKTRVDKPILIKNYKKLTYEKSYVFGVLCGDGNFSKNRVIPLSIRNGDLNMDFLSCRDTQRIKNQDS